MKGERFRTGDEIATGPLERGLLPVKVVWLHVTWSQTCEIGKSFPPAPHEARESDVKENTAFISLQRGFRTSEFFFAVAISSVQSVCSYVTLAIFKIIFSASVKCLSTSLPFQFY